MQKQRWWLKQGGAHLLYTAGLGVDPPGLVVYLVASVIHSAPLSREDRVLVDIAYGGMVASVPPGLVSKFQTGDRTEGQKVEEWRCFPFRLGRVASPRVLC